MSATTEDRLARPDFLTGFDGMHDAMRRDAARLVTVSADRTTPFRAHAGKALATWWTHVERTIVHHHEREDDIVWPELERRRPEFGEPRRALDVDHHALDDAMRAVRDALGAAAAGDDDPIARHGAITRFASLLVDHLEREEAAAFPLIAVCFTGADFRDLEQQMSKQTTLGHIAFELPWVLDGASDSVVALGAELLPAPVHLLNRLLFTPRYRRLTAPLLASSRTLSASR